MLLMPDYFAILPCRRLRFSDAADDYAAATTIDAMMPCCYASLLLFFADISLPYMILASLRCDATLLR